MKKLKGFIRQMEKPKGSMEKGYMVHESFYYESEYIKKIDYTPKTVFGRATLMRTKG